MHAETSNSKPSQVTKAQNELRVIILPGQQFKIPIIQSPMLWNKEKQQILKFKRFELEVIWYFDLIKMT